MRIEFRTGAGIVTRSQCLLTGEPAPCCAPARCSTWAARRGPGRDGRFIGVDNRRQARIARLGGEIHARRMSGHLAAPLLVGPGAESEQWGAGTAIDAGAQ
ncbi:hypothetical protein [Massilia brevitalea]|uniref:hypothetical protein n=1 Tax=Massilia brevitalea TaxID=442526 RepID=UPI0027392663|nr:hypothetical protein [Massilia brevitalea]